MKFACHTLGCKANSYDTSELTAGFEHLGYELTDDDAQADVILINTCAVTNESERKSRQLIRRSRSRSREAVIIVTGCFSEVSREEAEKMPEADIVTGTSDRDEIFKKLADLTEPKSERSAYRGDIHPVRFEGRHRAFVKIQDGCSMFCSYCIIPYARNRMVSEESSSICAQIRSIAENGYKEAVLTGIHIASYRDSGGTGLSELLSMIDRTGIERLRLGSLSPLILSEDFLSRLSGVSCFCPHFHISLQSGSSRILELMNRHYSAEMFFDTLKRVREHFPDSSVTTDIITGFPGETEEDFELTKQFVLKAGFAHVHIFPFSPKKGTPAASMPGQVSSEEKKRRAEELALAAKKTALAEREKYVGRTVRILAEKLSEKGLYEGFSRSYIKTAAACEEDITGRTADVFIDSAGDEYLIGRVI